VVELFAPKIMCVNNGYFYVSELVHQRLVNLNRWNWQPGNLCKLIQYFLLRNSWSAKQQKRFRPQLAWRNIRPYPHL